MKNFKLETVKMRNISSFKLKTKLYFLIFKRNLNTLFSIRSLKFAIPAIAFGIMTFGFLTNFDLLNENQKLTELNNVKTSTLVKAVFDNKNQRIAKAKLNESKMKKYKLYSMVRTNNLKMN